MRLRTSIKLHFNEVKWALNTTLNVYEGVDTCPTNSYDTTVQTIRNAHKWTCDAIKKHQKQRCPKSYILTSTYSWHASPTENLAILGETRQKRPEKIPKIWNLGCSPTRKDLEPLPHFALPSNPIRGKRVRVRGVGEGRAENTVTEHKSHWNRS